MEFLVSVIEAMPAANQRTFQNILRMCGSPEPTGKGQKKMYDLDLAQVPAKPRRIFMRAYRAHVVPTVPKPKSSRPSGRGTSSSGTPSKRPSRGAKAQPLVDSPSGSSSDQ
jgi:hypothetical protein